MPAGDPAGYLPNVRRARKRLGQRLYQPRGKAIKPAIPSVPNSRAVGSPPPAHKHVPEGAYRTGFSPVERGRDLPTRQSPRARRGGRKRYFGRGA